MKPIDLENHILLALRRASHDGITVNALYRALVPAGSRSPTWRDVANGLYRLERQGLVHIVGDELSAGTECQPLFWLSHAGLRLAHNLINQQQAAAAPQEETDRADD
jgi:hypothetical protein